MPMSALDPTLSYIERIRLYRMRIGLTQDQLADQVGISRTYLSHIERGIHTPNVELFSRIATALGVTMTELFGE